MFIPVFLGISWFYISSSEGAHISQPAVVVASKHGEASLICGYKVSNMVEIRFSLLKKIGSHASEMCVLSFSTNYEPYTSGDTIQCVGIPGPNNVTYHISGLQVGDTGLYSCKMEVMYPPPYRTAEGNGTFIYVSDLASQCAQSMEPEESTLNTFGIFITFLVLLVYSVMVTIVLILKRWKNRWDKENYGQVLQSNYKNSHPYYIKM